MLRDGECEEIRSMAEALLSLSIVELVFWTIVEGLRSQKTKEESQPPVRAKVGATLVPYRSQKQLL